MLRQSTLRCLAIIALGAALFGPQVRGQFIPLWAMNTDGGTVPFDPGIVGAYLDFYVLRGLQASVVGEEVASLGDINEDGRTDFIVGHRGSQSATVYSGHTAWSFEPGHYPKIRGAPDLMEAKGVSVSGSPEVVAGMGFGFDVANVFDVVGDSTNDYLVSAPHHYGMVQGMVYLYDGATHDLALIIENTNSNVVNFGWSIAGLGDIDEGGKADFAIGAPNNGGGGHAFIFLGESFTATGQTVSEDTADQVLIAPSGYSGTVHAFGGCVAAGGDSDGDDVVDSILVGAPTTHVPASSGAIYRAGAVFPFRWQTSGSVMNGAMNISTGPGLQPRLVGGTTLMVFEGKGACSFFGFDISLIGRSNHDLAMDFVIGAMGRSPLGTDTSPDDDDDPYTCPSSAYDAGYAEVYSGLDGSIIAMTQGQPQPGDRARYGAYVAGDIDLDDDFKDCDLNLSGHADVMVSSYRRKPASALTSTTWPDTGTGSLNLFDGSYSNAAWVSPHIWVNSWCAPFTPGGGVMNGAVSGALFGEALAWLPRSADYPRLAVYEANPIAESVQNIRILSPFGHATIPDAESISSAVDPVIDWAPGSGTSAWTDGELRIQLSATAHDAIEILVVPSLSLANIATPLTPYGYHVEPPTIVSGGDTYPLYPLVFYGVPQSFPIFGSSLVDFDSTEWESVPIPTSASSTGTPEAIPFGIGYNANSTRYPNHPLAHQRGAHLYLQVFELYEDRIRASNLMILRMNPDQQPPTPGTCP